MDGSPINPTTGFALSLDVGGEQLRVDRPTGERYCNFALLDAGGFVHAYLSGYGANVDLVKGRPDAPFLRIGNACIPLPNVPEQLRELAAFIGLPHDHL